MDETDDIELETASTKETTAKSSGKSRGLVSLPLTRVKSIIKSDPEVFLAGQETVFLMAKITEMFIGYIANKAYHYTKLGKRKTIQDKDVHACLVSHDELTFLEGMLDSISTDKK